MFRTVPVPIIRSLLTVHSAMVYVIQVCRQLSSRTSWSCSIAVWHIPLLRVQWINSWWWTEELSETCRVSCQNKFVKLVRLVDFITKKCLKSCLSQDERRWRQQKYLLCYSSYFCQIIFFFNFLLHMYSSVLPSCVSFQALKLLFKFLNIFWSLRKVTP